MLPFEEKRIYKYNFSIMPKSWQIRRISLEYMLRCKIALVKPHSEPTDSYLQLVTTNGNNCF